MSNIVKFSIPLGAKINLNLKHSVFVLIVRSNFLIESFSFKLRMNPSCMYHVWIVNASEMHHTVWHTSQKMSTIWVTFEFGTMTSGHTLRVRIAKAKFFTLQAQAIAGFSSCGKAACYPEILRISYNFVQDNICIGQITWWSGWCYVNKGKCKLNQSNDYSFVERVAKNNSWNMTTATKFMRLL